MVEAVWPVPFIIAVRVLANPVANVFQKRLTQRGAHPLMVIAAAHAALFVAALPWSLTLRWLSLDPAFWPEMGLCAVLAVSGNVLLVAALRSMDLSVLGPINAYKAVVSLALGTVLLGELPSLAGLAGVLLIVAGSFLVVDRTPGQPRARALVRFLEEPGVRLRFAALACSATEAVFLKRAMLLAAPEVTFISWVVLCFPLAALAAAVALGAQGGGQLRLVWQHRGSYLGLALATALMQLATLLAFKTLMVGYALALFQLSSLVSVALGARLFAEPSFARRLAGSAVMAAGAALIIACR
jgi:drug/metabolite transporter (DMT)-like permease